MGRKAGVLANFIVVTGVTVGASVLLAGCSKDKPARSQQAKPMDKAAAQAQVSSDQPGSEAVGIEQKTCPVMEGNAIDKNVFVEYKGKKAYFCCADCKAKFLANPEQYLSKLPQFAE
jgi:YHS domain-containing protein